MKTRAIILKKQNTNEYDQLVTCYTEEFGKVVAVAKSILKPTSIQAMHLDLFNLVEFELLNSRSIPIITGAQSENSFLNLKKDLKKVSCAYFFAEVMDRIAYEYQRDSELWNFWNSLLEELDQDNKDINKIFQERQVEFLNILGYAPNLEDCAFCQKNGLEEMIAYSIEAKGTICRDCFLEGKRGIVVKDGDFTSGPILSGMMESLTEKKINSLNLIKVVLE